MMSFCDFIFWLLPKALSPVDSRGFLYSPQSALRLAQRQLPYVGYAPALEVRS
jgi:hypothetical protein